MTTNSTHRRAAEAGTPAAGSAGPEARRLLLEAAERLFAERGLEGVSVREIAAEAGVSHGGLNYHFGTKEQLYVAVLKGNALTERRERELREALEVIEPGEARRHLEIFIRSLIHALTRPLEGIAAGLLTREVTRHEGPREVVFEVIDQDRRVLEHLLGILAPHITDPVELRLVAVGTLSQAALYRLARPVTLRLIGVEQLEDELVDRIGDEILRTTLLRLGLPAPDEEPSS